MLSRIYLCGCNEVREEEEGCCKKRGIYEALLEYFDEQHLLENYSLLVSYSELGGLIVLMINASVLEQKRKGVF